MTRLAGHEDVPPHSGEAAMPFGQHKGRALSEVPLDYLQWLFTIELREPLCSAVITELDRRGAFDGTPEWLREHLVVTR